MVITTVIRIFSPFLKTMKRFIWYIPLCVLLYACPMESRVPMEPGPVEPIDSSLVGYWYGIIKDGSDYFGIEALDITRYSDSLYSITRYGKAAKGDMILPDTSYFTGYTSYIGEKRFMNIEGSVVIVNTRGKKAPEVKTEKVYYVSAFEMRHDTLSVKAVTDGFSSNKQGFKSSADLKQVITDMVSQNKNIYDDLYTLSYRKIPRPQPQKGF
jgi:hypothetical protein